MKISKELIYEKLRQVPFGYVTTYKELALSLNSKAYRFVGRAMKDNKETNNIPCFKVIKSDGNIGNYSLGVKEKIKRLKKEGINIKNGKIVDFKNVLYKFKKRKV